MMSSGIPAVIQLARELPFVVVPFLQFPVGEVGASAEERDEPVAVEPSPAGLDGVVDQLVDHRHAGRQLGPLVVRWSSGSVVLTECINGDGALEGRQSGAAGTSGVVEDRYKTVISQQNEPLSGPRMEVAERIDPLIQQCHLRDRSAGRSQQVHGVACELSTGPAARSSSLVSHEDILPLRDCTASGEVQSFDVLGVTDGTVALRDRLTHLVHLFTQKPQQVLGCPGLRRQGAEGSASAL